MRWNDTTRARSVCHCVNIRRAARAITQVYDRIMAPSGLRVTQFSLLRTLERAGRTSISELAERLALDRTTLTRNLRPLDRQGLLRMTSGDDRRMRSVELTRAGARAIRTALPLWERAQQQVSDRVGARELEATLAALSTVESMDT